MSKNRKTNFTYKKILSVFMLFLLIFMSCPATAYAASSEYEIYSFVTSGSFRDINATNSILKNAKKKASKIKKNFSQSGKIEKAYETHVYHFEAPKSGYYAFYTTGKLDTVIKIYEEQNTLWMVEFESHGFNDDGSKVDTNRTNAGMVVELDSGEDYYVCVRAYHNDKGEYTLNVEPNQDKLLATKYNYTKWQRTSMYDPYVGVYNDTTSETKLYTYFRGTKTKQYLSKSDVIFFYWSLDPACQKAAKATGKDINYVYSEYKKDYSLGLKAANFILSSLPLDDIIPAYGITTSILGSVLECLYDSTEVTPYEMMETLVRECGVNYDGKNWSADKRFMIEEIYDESFFRQTYYSYGSYNSDMYVGIKYEKGDWIK